MWKSLLRCGIVGGIMVFLWMMVSWMILPLHKVAMNRFVDESEVVSTVTRYAPKDGIYILPNMDGRQEVAKGKTFIFMNIKRGVNFGDMAAPMAIGVITQIIAAMFATYLLLKTKAMKYWNRVWFVTIVGIFAVLVGVIPAWNWWYFPGNWILFELFDIIIGWFLAGLVIAKLQKN